MKLKYPQRSYACNSPSPPSPEEKILLPDAVTVISPSIFPENSRSSEARLPSPLAVTSMSTMVEPTAVF